MQNYYYLKIVSKTQQMSVECRDPDFLQVIMWWVGLGEGTLIQYRSSSLRKLYLLDLKCYFSQLVLLNF